VKTGKLVLALAGLLALLLAVLLAVFFFAVRGPISRLRADATQTATAQCEPLYKYTCKDLSVEFVATTSGIPLPAGTKVADSGTSALSNWAMGATVTLPLGSAPLAAEPSYSATGIIPLKKSASGELRYRITQVRRPGETWPIP
jgi:hypothetical protein